MPHHGVTNPEQAVSLTLFILLLMYSELSSLRSGSDDDVFLVVPNNGAESAETLLQFTFLEDS